MPSYMCKRCISINLLACPNCRIVWNEISMIIQSAFWLVVWNVFPSAASAPGVLSLRGELDKRLTQLKACRVISNRQHLQWCQNFKHISQAEFGKVQTLMSRYLKQVSAVVSEGFIQVVRSLAPLCTILPFMNSYIVPHDRSRSHLAGGGISSNHWPSSWYVPTGVCTLEPVLFDRYHCQRHWVSTLLFCHWLERSISGAGRPNIAYSCSELWMFLWGGMGWLNFSGRNNPVIRFLKKH